MADEQNIGAARARKCESKIQPPLSLSDYCRLHSVIRSALSVFGSSATRSCLFYALAGAYVLQKVHQLNARPSVGGAFFCLDESETGPTVLSYAKREADGSWFSDSDAFHAWIEVVTTGSVWYVDLTAPMYGEALNVAGFSGSVPSRAFMRPAEEMMDHVEDIQGTGDFYFARSEIHTLDAIKRAVSGSLVGDVADICRNWYRATPSPIRSEILVGSSDGVSRTITLLETSVSDIW